MEFLKAAKDFARNPLGIIALFISLIYGFAGLLFNYAAEKITLTERWPIIIFIVIFPFVVLWVFYDLVIKHHWKLYAPKDFKEDKSFLNAIHPLTREEQEAKLNQEIEDIEKLVNKRSKIQPEIKPETFDTDVLKNEYREILDRVVGMISGELNAVATRGVRIGESHVIFDAFFAITPITCLEIKLVRRINDSSLKMITLLLYDALLTQQYWENELKVIIVCVYDFDKTELCSLESYWQQEVEKCPVDIDLRFIPKQEVLID